MTGRKIGGSMVIGLLIVTVLAALSPRDAAAYKPPSYWSTSTWDGVSLQAWSQISFTFSGWSGAGFSQSSQNIDRIGITNQGRERCGGTIFQKWYDGPRTYQNTYYSSAQGSSYQINCNVCHGYQSYSAHDFYRSGSFGANPYTAAGDDLDQC